MIYLCLEGLEGFVVLDGELVAVVEGFADFVFLELLFVVGPVSYTHLTLPTIA